MFKISHLNASQLTAIKEFVTGYFRQFADWLRKGRFNIYISSFAFDLVDLAGVEEIEILPDMSVNFKDFAVETRFVVAISVRGHV